MINLGFFLRFFVNRAHWIKRSLNGLLLLTLCCSDFIIYKHWFSTVPWLHTKPFLVARGQASVAESVVTTQNERERQGSNYC